MASRPRRVLIGCAGSVASIKLDILVQTLLSKTPGVEIKVLLTEHAQHFTKKKDSTSNVQYYTDSDEWESWRKIGDDVLHIELGRWADLFVIAPLSANSLAKMATGICDNLLTCTVRAWDTSKPLLFAPAMNTRMLEHPITRPQIETLISWGYVEIPTIEKRLACGDLGFGAMAEPDTIVGIVDQKLTEMSKG